MGASWPCVFEARSTKSIPPNTGPVLVLLAARGLARSDVGAGRIGSDLREQERREEGGHGEAHNTAPKRRRRQRRSSRREPFPPKFGS
eukprot:1173802-Prymnesium_polylepis.3